MHAAWLWLWPIGVWPHESWVPGCLPACLPFPQCLWRCAAFRAEVLGWAPEIYRGDGVLKASCSFTTEIEWLCMGDGQLGWAEEIYRGEGAPKASCVFDS